MSCDDESSHIRRYVLCKSIDVESRLIIHGITNAEQGRWPRINESLYFVNIDQGIVFYLYDDRGCLIYFTSEVSQHELSELRTDWLVR